MGDEVSSDGIDGAGRREGRDRDCERGRGGGHREGGDCGRGGARRLPLGCAYVPCARAWPRLSVDVVGEGIVGVVREVRAVTSGLRIKHRKMEVLRRGAGEEDRR